MSYQKLLMYNRDKLSLDSIQDGWKDLGKYLNMYLESRIRDALPQATYKRFLVSRHRPDLCDLLDDIRDNKIPSPSWFSEYREYEFSVRVSDVINNNMNRVIPFHAC